LCMMLHFHRGALIFAEILIGAKRTPIQWNGKKNESGHVFYGSCASDFFH
jgi:hypothetical protein